MKGQRLHVLIMAKTPVAGQVKTRLCPPCTPPEAAGIAAAALADTLDAVAGCRADRKIIALAGEPGPWVPRGFEVITQRGAGLDERLANAWADAGGPGLSIGMDTPQLCARDLDALLDRVCVRPGRALLGPAVDGGWWVIGWDGTDPEAVFEGVPMSTPMTGRAQLQRLGSLGLEVDLVETRRDLDTFDDLLHIARLAPDTRTAAIARRFGLQTDAA